MQHIQQRPVRGCQLLNHTEALNQHLRHILKKNAFLESSYCTSVKEGGKKELTDQNLTYICFDKLAMIVVKSKIVVTNVQKHVYVHLKNVYIYI